MTDASSPVTIEQLLSHAAWLRGLAWEMVRDHAAAEDLVQETWLSALRSPPREPGAVRAWLRRVLKRHAWEAHRVKSARVQREERTARRDAAPDTASLVARADVQQRLIRAVLALDEPYRSTVLLRYFEELPPREVAARLGAPVETVRARLRRARQRLRASLDEHDRRPGAWVGALLPLLDHGPPPVGTGAAAGFLGVLAMGVKTKVGVMAAVLCLGLLAWWGFSDGEAGLHDGVGTEPPAVETATRPPRERTRDPATEEEGLAAAPRVAAAPPAVDEAEEAAVRPRVRLTGRLVVRGAGTDAAVTLTIVREWSWRDDPRPPGEPPSLSVTAHPAEPFDLDLTPLFPTGAVNRFRVQVDHPDYVPYDERISIDGEGEEPWDVTHDVTLTVALIATGRVVDEKGDPLPDAAVGAFVPQEGKQPDLRLDVTRTDARGEYRLRLPPETGGRLVVAADRHLPAVARFAALAAAGPLDEMRLAPGLSVEGRVLEEGSPAPGIEVGVTRYSEGKNCAVGSFRVDCVGDEARLLRKVTSTDEGGRYLLTGLSDVEYGIVLGLDDAAPGFAREMTHTLTPPATGIDFEIGGARLVLTVVAPVPLPDGVEVYLKADSRSFGSFPVDAGGEIVLRARPGQTFSARVTHAGFERFETKVTIPAAAAEHRERLELVPRSE